jgi:beta-alanine degradation protein BauB
MKKLTIGIAATLLFGASAMAADTDAGSPRLAEDSQSKQIPFEDMTFSHTDFVAYGPRKPGDNATPDILAFDAYGKAAKGPHAAILKWPKGFKSVLHTHTGDYYAVVISGVMANYRPGDKIVHLSAGSYWFQKGGEPHITECFSENCTAVLVQNMKFDAQPLGGDWH